MLVCIQRFQNACGSDRNDNGWLEGKADPLQSARPRTDNCREWVCSFATGLVMVERDNNGAIARAKTFLRARLRLQPLNFAIARRRIRYQRLE